MGARDEVVVVDNGSQDATAAGLRRYPWVRVVSNAENRGFAAACNQGAALARGEVVVFLNNDWFQPAGWTACCGPSTTRRWRRPGPARTSSPAHSSCPTRTTTRSA